MDEEIKEYFATVCMNISVCMYVCMYVLYLYEPLNFIKKNHFLGREKK